MASTSVLKLVIDDKEYNASLKEARTGMQHLENALNSANKTFNQVDKSVVDYVRGIGQMEAQSKTAKGRIGEMTTAFVELSMQYSKMSDEIKSGDVGKALAESMQTLKQRTIDAKQELAELNSQLDTSKSGISGGGMGNIGGLLGGDKLSGMLQVFGGNLMTKAAGYVAQFVGEMGEAVKQGIELARSGEGIRNAFERLGRGDILDGLREATHGTVTDLELMKAAVKFNDFKLPLDELGTMLAFAQQKAKDTGQSVDYMVDSIVTGLGRKSLMILDNLGLSANEIKEKMKDTGDMTKAVGQIIREQMAKSGDYVETAADRAAQANVDLQNKMEELGRKFGPIEEASNQLWTSMKIAILDVVSGPLASLLNGLTEAGRMKNMLDQINGSTGTGQTHSGKTLGMLKNYRGDKKDLYNRQLSRYIELENQAWREANQQRSIVNRLRQEQRGNPEALDQNALDAAIRRMEKAQAKAKAFAQIRSEYQAGAKQILNPSASGDGGGTVGNSLTSLSNKLKELRKLRDKAIEEGDIAARDMYNAQIKATQAQIKNLRGTTTTTTKHPKVKKTDYEKLIEKTSSDLFKTRFGIKKLLGSEAIEIPGKVYLKETTEQDIKDQLDQFAPKDPFEIDVDVNFKVLKEIEEKELKKMMTTAQMAASAVSSIGEAFANIEDPSAKAAGTVMQAIASIALGFAQAAAAKDTTTSGWGWLAWLAAGAAAMATTISTIHSLTNLSEGGFVPGNSYSGDNIPANGGTVGLNSGELVLNRSQQNNLANALQGGPQSIDLRAVVSGEQIVLVANRSLKRKGKGELVTWK